MEGGEEQVTVDYANDLDTGMCVQHLVVCPECFVADDMPRALQLRKRISSNSRPARLWLEPQPTEGQPPECAACCRHMRARCHAVRTLRRTGHQVA